VEAEKEPLHLGQAREYPTEPSTHTSGKEKLGIRYLGNTNLVIEEQIHDHERDHGREDKDPHEILLPNPQEAADYIKH
jgi:hypothetical protein